MKKNKIILLILILSIGLRLFDLSGNRPHLTNDEAALGYNAYSILKTGRDEHGSFMPVVFKSFGDWKPGLYVYTAVPTVAIFGLNEFSTRLPSALAGVIAVYYIYLLSLKIFDNKKLAALSSFFLAISPWHVTFSRGAWEANLALTLTLAAVYYLFVFIKDKTEINIYYSALFFGLSLWAYQSAKLASVLILLGIVIFYHKELLVAKRKPMIKAALFGFLISIPIIYSLISGQGGRLNVMSVFSSPRSEEYIYQTITSQENYQSDLEFKIFHSESFNFLRGISARYFNHYAGRFLFFEGDWANARHTSPNIGYILLIDSIFLLFGLIYSAKNVENKGIRFILFWFAVSPLASALSRDSVHGIRSFNMVLPLSIILALGANYILDLLSKKGFIKIALLLIFIPIYIFNYLFFLDAYFIHGPIKNSQNFMYGYKQIAEKILPMQDQYEEIVVNLNYDQAYIYFLFYGAAAGYDVYQPTSYQKTNYFQQVVEGDVGIITQLDNIFFRPINWSADKNKDGLILIARESEFPIYELEGSLDYKFERIYNLDGSPGFIILEVTR